MKNKRKRNRYGDVKINTIKVFILFMIMISVIPFVSSAFGFDSSTTPSINGDETKSCSGTDKIRSFTLNDDGSYSIVCSTDQTSNTSGGTDITWTEAINGSLMLTTGDTSTGNYTFDTNTLFIDSSIDRIGIGTTSPTQKLTVIGNIDTSVAGGPIIVDETAQNNNPTLVPDKTDMDTGLGQAGSNQGSLIAQGFERIYFSPSQIIINDISRDSDFRVESNDETHMFYVDGTNNRIGINTSTPQQTLNIIGELNVSNSTGNLGLLVNNKGMVGIGEPTLDFRLEIKGKAPTGYVAVTNSADGDILKIDTTGQMGIGTNSPGVELEVESTDGDGGIKLDSSGHASIQIDRSATNKDGGFLFFDAGSLKWRFGQLGSTGSNINNFVIHNQALGLRAFSINSSTNNVAIGVTKNPSDALTVTGDINVSGCIEEDDGTLIGGTCVSDAKTKKNLVNYDIDLSKLSSLSPKEFEYKKTTVLAGYKLFNITSETYDDNLKKIVVTSEIVNKSIYYNLPSGTQKGFVADEVETHYPEFVKTDEFGTKQIIYGFNWVFELWKQNQEQQTQINQMQSTLCKLGETEYC